MLAAIGALAAVLAECTIEIERIEGKAVSEEMRPPTWTLARRMARLAALRAAT